jgi:hypothetical protein
MKTGEAPDGFLSRWSRRKEQARVTVVVPAATPPAVVEAPITTRVEPVPVSVSVRETPAAEPLPTLADVAALNRESDYSRFMARDVDNGVKQAAMKKLFTDPHFNVMDGLDTYIDDYGKPDPIPLAMLRRMNQSKFLRLFEHEEEQEEVAAQPPALTAEPATPETLTAPDDHADLRLQQDDAAGQPGPRQGAGA